MTESNLEGVPTPVRSVAGLMEGFEGSWALAGGWAVDAWLGHQTRPHPDVDIAVPLQDAKALFNYLQGWQLIAHHPPLPDDTAQLWDGGPLTLPAHVHARPWAAEALPERLEDVVALGFWLDVQFDERSDDAYVLDSERGVSLPLDQAVGVSPWSVPALRPQALLYFKAVDLRPRDESDFAALLPRLSDGEKAWLRQATEADQPRHVWLGRL